MSDKPKDGRGRAPASTERTRHDTTGRFVMRQAFSGETQQPSQATVTLPRLKFMEGEPLPRGARLAEAHWLTADPDVEMI